MFAYAKREQKKISKDTIQKKENKKSVSKPNLTGIQDDLKTRFENMSGFSFDDVRVHYNSDKPAQLQALAYAQGNQVHISPGQEKHLAHELAHVVQQKEKRVKPNFVYNNAAINNSGALEREADNLAGMVLQQKKQSVSHINIKEQSYLPVVQLIKSTDLSEGALEKGTTYKVGDEYVRRWKKKSKSKENADSMKNDWDAVNSIRIPTPAYRTEQLEDVAGEYVFITKKCKGDVFFKNSNKTTELVSWLITGRHSMPFLIKMSRIFRNVNLGDPQGFFEKAEDGVVEFIDITKPGSGGTLMTAISDSINRELANRMNTRK